MNGGGKRKRETPSSETTTVRLEDIVSPDFEELCRQFPPFATAYRSLPRGQGLQATPEFSVALTRAILQVHFRLSLRHLPSHRLCPPVPNRYFLMQWIDRDLMPLLTNRPRTYLGLDIGTGASCIYPLLMVRRNPRYRMLAIDIDPEAVQMAQQNVADNQLLDKIDVRLVAPTTRQSSGTAGRGPLPPDVPVVDFVCTNPPFFDTDQALPTRRDGQPRTVMTHDEGRYPGGEVAFCLDLLGDTLVAPQNPGWTVCMLGQKASLVKLQAILTQILGPSKVRTTEYGPGTHTRWFLAWTFEDLPIAPGLSWTMHVDETWRSEIPQRLADYCTTFGDWSWTWTSATEGVLTSTIAHERAPLPQELQHIDTLPQNILRPEPCRVQVTLGSCLTFTPYVSTSSGQSPVLRLQQHLPGELTRTNRRWRRLASRTQT